MRKETREIIFNTRNDYLIFSDLYLELTTKLPTEFLFGYGEKNSPNL